MNKIGIIVDGPCDYSSLRTRFTGTCKILKTDGPRGHTVSVSDIVNSSSKQVSMLRDCDCEKIVILVDFEMRTDDYAGFVTNLGEALSRHYTAFPVSAAVPNRMIENWYLADIEYLSKEKSFLKNSLRQKNYEGSHGKEELKKCFTSRYSYSETIHGPQMFAILRFDTARQNSASFDDFLLIVGYSTNN